MVIKGVTIMKYLEGKEISDFELIGDTQLVFYLKSPRLEKVIYTAIGDCCSESFFHSIEGISFLRNCKVLQVIEHPDKEIANSYQEADELYGYTLIVLCTYEGQPIAPQRVEIEFRNSSNGYYGGELEEDIILLPAIKGDIS